MLMNKGICSAEFGSWAKYLSYLNYFQLIRFRSKSSDSSFIVFSAIEENPGSGAKPRLYLRKMDQGEATPITGTEGAINPFLSPDNHWVGFWANGKLQKIPVEGGLADPLCDAPLIFGADWGRDNRIVFCGDVFAGLSVVSAEGGQPLPMTVPDRNRGEISHRLPSWLPDGKRVLSTVATGALNSKSRIAVLRPDNGEWSDLLQDGADARYVPTGHIVFLRRGELWAVRFDTARCEVVGEPRRLLASVMQSYASSNDHNTGAGQYAVSDIGGLVYAVGGIPPPAEHSLVWVDHNGREELVTELRGPYNAPRLSPDGRRIAYATWTTESRIMVYDLERETNTPLTHEGHATWPKWTADGNRLLFVCWIFGFPEFFWQPFDRSSGMEPFTKTQGGIMPRSWPHQMFAYVWSNPGTGRDITLWDTESGKRMPYLNSRFNERYPEFWPDGRWIAYTIDDSDRNEVWVQNFPDGTIKGQVSRGGGAEPLWARDGKQLFFTTSEQMWAVDVQADGDIVLSKPRPLFNLRGYMKRSPYRCSDIDLDSRRFFMVKLDDKKPTPATELILVQNWFEEPKRLLPTDGLAK